MSSRGHIAGRLRVGGGGGGVAVAIVHVAASQLGDVIVIVPGVRL